MDPAYRNREDLGEKRISEARASAPANVDFLNMDAIMARWRGLPERASHITQLSRTYAPLKKETLLNMANNAEALGEYDDWKDLIEPLHQRFPKDNFITDSWLRLKDRSRPSMFSQISLGSSDGSNIVNGGRDIKWESRINSPWCHRGWRLYLRHLYQWADFEEGSSSYNRIYLGAQWRRKRSEFFVEVGGERLGAREAGVAAGWSQWLGDHWQYRIKADSYSTDTPLRAHRTGIEGKALSLELDWRKDESLSASLGLDILDLSDGNLRSALGTNITKRLFSSAHHITEGGMGFFASHGSRPGGPYFNPRNTQSLNLSLDHDWITWRRYERDFTQHFGATLAMEWQSDYHGEPALDLVYRHDWDLSRTWTIWYGLGWSTHVYDGVREQRWSGLMGIKGVL